MDKFPLTISLFPNVPPSVRFIPLEEDYDPPFPEVTYIVIQIMAKTLLLVLEQYQYIDIETTSIAKVPGKFAKMLLFVYVRN